VLGDLRAKSSSDIHSCNVNVHLFLWAALILTALTVWALGGQSSRAKAITTVFLLLLGFLVEVSLCRALLPHNFQRTISIGYPLALVVLIVTYQRLQRRTQR
jgi:hypothetical protein